MSDQIETPVIPVVNADVPPKPEVAVVGKQPLPSGPIEGVKYPIHVVYCGECSLPIEYCGVYGNQQRCQEWLERNMPDLFQEMHVSSTGDGIPTTDGTKQTTSGSSADGPKVSKRQTRGGKALPKAVKSAGKKAVDRYVGIARANRGKKKYVTVITGLSTFSVDLKDAAKFFSSKFACGSSVTGSDEIVIQGDVKDDLFDIICDKWTEITDDDIQDLGDRKL